MINSREYIAHLMRAGYTRQEAETEWGDYLEYMREACKFPPRKRVDPNWFAEYIQPEIERLYEIFC